MDHVLAYLTLALQDSPGGAGEAESGSSGLTQTLIYVGGLVAIFYFMMIRPQKRENERRTKMLGELKKHDTVVTNSGIIAQIVEIGDDIVTLKVDDNQNVRVRFKRQAIVGLLESPADKSADRKRGTENGKPDPAPEARSGGRGAR